MFAELEHGTGLESGFIIQTGIIRGGIDNRGLCVRRMVTIIYIYVIYYIRKIIVFSNRKKLFLRLEKVSVKKVYDEK